MDARHEGRSHWMRLVRFATNKDEQNMEAYQYQGNVYYRCARRQYFPVMMIIS